MRTEFLFCMKEKTKRIHESCRGFNYISTESQVFPPLLQGKLKYKWFRIFSFWLKIPFFFYCLKSPPMNYSVNSHNRKLKHRIHTLLDRLSFNFLNLSGSYKVSLLGVILLGCSLLFSWASFPSDGDVIKTFSAFSVYAGYIGFITLLTILFLGIIILSNTSRERIKSRTRMFFPDHTIIIFSGIIHLFMSFILLNTIRWLNILIGQNVSAGKGLIFSFIGALFIVLGGILTYRTERKELLEKMYVSNAQDSQNELREYEHILGKKSEKDSTNMSLPI